MMKSAAFNLAFKVHRNELSFAEGLLKSVESEAQEDFIEALNSLAGETKYDVGQLEKLIEQARQSVMQDTSPKVDAQAIQQELDSLQKKRRDIEESIQTYHSQKAAMKPSILPGINSFLLGIVGFVISLVILLLFSVLPFLILFSITIIVSVVLLMQDLTELNKQKENIEKRKHKINQEIGKLESARDELEDKIREKQSLIQSATGSSAMDSSYPPPQEF